MDTKRYSAINQLLQRALDEQGKASLVVSGNSMAPFLKPGDRIEVHTAAAYSLKQGDVVMLKREKDCVTHRIVHLKPPYIKLKGDNIRNFDPPFQPEDLLGVVRRIEKNGKSITISSPAWERKNRRIARFSYWEGRCFERFSSWKCSGMLCRLVTSPLRFLTIMLNLRSI